MSERFGEVAVRLFGMVNLLLGWRPEEFWSCTPAEVAAALRLSEAVTEGPDAETIHALRLRFPDHESR